MRDGRGIKALANWYTFRIAPLYFGPDDCRREQKIPLLTALARDLAGEAPRVSLAPLGKAESDAVETAFRSAGWSVFATQCDFNHVLPINGRSYAQYLATRPGRLRSTLKRKAGKVSVELSTRFDAALWADFEAVYDASWKPEEGSPAFLRSFARQEGEAGRLRLGIARFQGEPVAAQFWTVENGTAFIHKLAHTEASRSLSPGTTLSAALFEHVIDTDRVSLVDFGTGNDAYKHDWMEHVRPLYRMDAYRPFRPGNWPVIAITRLRSKLQRV